MMRTAQRVSDCFRASMRGAKPVVWGRHGQSARG